MNLVDILHASLRRRGLPISTLEVDHTWGMAQKPVDVRMVPRPLSVGVMPTYFYRTMFRWSLEDGTRWSAVLDPIVKLRGGSQNYYELDGMAMAEQLGTILRGHCAALATPENGG